MKTEERNKQLVEEIENLRKQISFYESLHQKESESSSGDELGILAQALYSSPVSMVIIDKPTGFLLNVNQSFTRLTGYLREQIIGKPIDALELFSDIEGTLLSYEQMAGSDREIQYKTSTGHRGIAMLGWVEFIYQEKECLLGSFIDITVSKLMENELRDSEKKFASLFNTNPSSVTITEVATGRYIEVNEAFTRITGYTREEVIGRTAQDVNLMVEWDEEYFINQLNINQKAENIYFVIRSKDGEIKHGLMFAALYTYNGKTCVIRSSLDITSLKHAEAGLRRSKEQLQQIVSASPAPICISTLSEGRYLDVNESFVRLIGYSRSEIVGKTIDEINFLVDIKRDVYVNKLLTGQSINNMEITMRNEGGEILYGLFSAHLYIVDNVPCILSTIFDITERKLTEKALAEMEARFHSVFYYSPTMMIITRADNGKIIDANNAWLNAMGYTLEEVIGKNAGDLKIWVDSDRYEIVRCIEQTGQLNTEVRVRTHHNEILNTITSAIQTTVNDEQCVLIYCVDITEQMLMHNGLARLDRLNLVGQMAASLGHEVRNPMTTVRGFLQMMKESDTDYVHQDYYSLMIEELDRGNKIISEFLALASDKKVDLCPCNLNNLLEQIYPLLRAEALLQEKWVNYHLQDVPELMLDEKEIRQLVINLANNGLEAMNPGGCLEVSTLVNKSGQVILEITDQGSGIAPDLLNRIGTPFLTTKENGVGLGLPICYSIAQRHGANIEFDSHTRGTVFRIKFNSLI